MDLLISLGESPGTYLNGIIKDIHGPDQFFFSIFFVQVKTDDVKRDVPVNLFHPENVKTYIRYLAGVKLRGVFIHVIVKIMELLFQAAIFDKMQEENQGPSGILEDEPPCSICVYALFQLVHFPVY